MTSTPTKATRQRRRTKEPLTIIVDTREQEPLTEWPEGTITERATLDTGDYSIKGWETSFTVERKSLDDLAGTMLNAYESNPRKPPKRFNNELWRMQRFDKRALVVTATPQDVMNYKFHCGKDSHGALWHFCCSIEATYNVPVHMIGNRIDAAKWIVDVAQHYVFARTRKYHSRAERLAAVAANFNF